MPSLLSACKRLLCNSLVILFPMMVSGQGLIPASQEYCIGGPLFGDQVRPQLIVTPSGGWMVWQDNSIDGKGFGIAASRLGSTCGTITNRFRVNETLGGNQEKPRITQLKDGTVMFAWEGMSSVLANVYARFMTPNRVFVTGEIPMTTTFPSVTNKVTTNMWSWCSNRYVLRDLTLSRVRQETRTGNTDPAVAPLKDGTAVLVYSGIRKYYTSAQEVRTEMNIVQGLPYANDVIEWVSSSGDNMGEIFMQRFTAGGAKLGEETLVNQFSTYNQRRPAVAALPNGNFVVVWVSERHFPEASGSGTEVNGEDRSDVQISARLFNSSGLPMSAEFRVNPTNAVICADPAVCAAADGSFMITWSRYDSKLVSNYWDVFGRVYTIGGQPCGASFKVNTWTAGEQSVPQIAALGEDFLVAWTSVGQDGSQEGVYGQLVTEGVLAGKEFRINTSTINKQMQPALASFGSSGFLAIWTHFSGMASGFNLMAQRLDLLTAPTPNPPTVTPIGQTSLLVSWPAIPALENYALYMDQEVNPVRLKNTSYEANGLAPGSTHSFRLAYALTNGAVSRLSEPAIGTTWASGRAPELAGSETNNAGNTGSVSGTGTTGSVGQAPIRLLLNRSGAILSLQWNSEAGAVYQTQMSTNLQRWSNVGDPQTGAGTTSTQNFPAESGAGFYRVIRVN